jgi:hypothetical protein
VIADLDRASTFSFYAINLNMLIISPKFDKKTNKSDVGDYECRLILIDNNYYRFRKLYKIQIVVVPRDDEVIEEEIKE